MSHCDIQIRDAVVDLVTGLTTAGSRVYVSPIYPLAANAIPGIVVLLGSQTLTPVELPRIYERRLAVYVIPCAGDNDDLDALLATMAAEVEVVLGMAAGPWKSLLLSSVDRDRDTSGEQPIGRQPMRYEATYYTRDGVPDAFL